jgi:hypothetical protein
MVEGRKETHEEWYLENGNEFATWTIERKFPVLKNTAPGGKVCIGHLLQTSQNDGESATPK